MNPSSQNSTMSSDKTNGTTSKKQTSKPDKKHITLEKSSPNTDTKTQLKKQSNNKRNKHETKTIKPKQHKNDDNHFEGSDWETSDESSGDEEIVLDESVYADFLNKMFPSTYSKTKAQTLKNEKTKHIETPKKEKETLKKENETPNKETIQTRSKKMHKKVVYEEEEDDEYLPSTELSESDSFDDEDKEELEQEIADLLNGKGKKFNIILSLGNDEYEDDTDDTDDDTEYSEESEDDEFDGYGTDDFERDNKLLEQFDVMRQTFNKKEYKNSVVLKNLDQETKYLKNSIIKYKNKKEKKLKEVNIKKFKKIMKEGTRAFDEKKFFKQCSLKTQETILKQLEEINKLVFIEKPYKFKLLETDIPNDLKACAIKKIEMLNHMDPGMGEFYKLKSWIDTFMEIPFGKYKQMPISIDNGIEQCREFMTNAKSILDKVAFGLDDAKMQIIQMMGMWLTNPNAVGSAIAIQGPPGTGKTTLVKEGISKILGRDFAFIALGGATDSSFLEGHSYTYEGSKWGKIVDILVQCKSMNPIIYFDELDKISDTAKGEEIIGILTHLTDTSQNSSFHDKYFSEVDFDLSKCLFIFSYNDESKINPILRDRMYRIYTQGYNTEHKRNIINDYLLPKIRETLKFETNDVVFSDDIINHIVTNYTEDEKGVRNLKRCMEIIYTKLNLYRYIDADSEFYTPQTEKHEKTQHKVEFPIVLNKDIVDKLLKKNENDTSRPLSMYM